jgi:hypothetical protein
MEGHCLWPYPSQYRLRIVVGPIHEREKRGLKRDLALLCSRRGRGQAMMIEKKESIAHYLAFFFNHNRELIKY